MSLDTPEGRLAYAETHSVSEYNAAMEAHIASETVDGIRPVMTRFGRLFAVADGVKAFRTREEAEAYLRDPKKD